MKFPLVPEYCLRPSQIPLTCVKFIKNNDILIGDFDGNLSLWSVQTRRKIKSIRSKDDSLNSLDSINNLCLCNYKSSGITLWDINSEFHQILTHNRDSSTFSNAKFCPFNPNLILIPNQDGKSLTRFDIRNKEQIDLKLSDPEGHIMCCDSIQCNGTSLAIGMFESGSIITWNIDSGELISKYSPLSSPILCGVSLPTSCKLIFGSLKNSLETLDLYVRGTDSLSRSISLTSNGISSLSYTKDEEILIAGSSNSRIFFIKNNIYEFRESNFHRKSISSIDSSNSLPDNSKSPEMIACASNDGTCSMWKIDYINKLFDEKLV